MKDGETEQYGKAGTGTADSVADEIKDEEIDKGIEFLIRIKRGYPGMSEEEKERFAGIISLVEETRPGAAPEEKKGFIDFCRAAKEVFHEIEDEKLKEFVKNAPKVGLEDILRLPGVKHNWNDEGHNRIIDYLEGFSKEDKEIIKNASRKYDENWRAFLDDEGHAIFGETESDYISNILVMEAEGIYFLKGKPYGTYGEAVKAARDEYAIDNEKARINMRNLFIGYLKAAINYKDKGDFNNALRNLSVALHLLADDYSHRQANVGLSKHRVPSEDSSGKMKTKISLPFYVPAVDDMNNPENRERFEKALEMANIVNNIYHEGVINNAVIDNKLFPRVYFK